MGNHEVTDDTLQGDELRAFMSALLEDLRALERMCAEGMIERDKRRIGAEQELFLVDKNWRPAMTATEVLDRTDDPHFVTELGLFNLEINLDPLAYGGDCLRQMETRLEEVLAEARRLAGEVGSEALLIGILPTLRESDLSLDNMTPKPRYFALNNALRRLRGGGAYEFRIRGLDELVLRHETVMAEACNASFQVHFQVDDHEFARLYNIAQLVTAPVLAVAVNSPLLFQRRLWHETRIALFQQAVDTRTSALPLRERAARVSFGRKWIKNSVLELFQEDIGRFKALIGVDLDEDPHAVLDAGGIPKLRALGIFNGTVWRWNRACYGVTDGKPHLRIENRVLPSGPTPLDQVANAAFWFGLIGGLAERDEDPRELLRFEDVKMNFNAAASSGLSAQFTWTGGRVYPARELIIMHLLPLAREGLQAGGIDAADIDRYLGVIEERTVSGKTGSVWMLDSLDRMPANSRPGERMTSLVAGMVSRQSSGTPVHEWEPAGLFESGGWKHNYQTVEQLMTTDLVTVYAEEPVTLAANLMHWERVRHIPVENHDHQLVGLVSYWGLLRFIGRGGKWVDDSGRPLAVESVMKRDVLKTSPNASALEAIKLMREKRVSCLPVVLDDNSLVGVITETDFMDIAAELFQQQLAEED